MEVYTTYYETKQKVCAAEPMPGREGLRRPVVHSQKLTRMGILKLKLTYGLSFQQTEYIREGVLSAPRHCTHSEGDLYLLLPC